MNILTDEIFFIEDLQQWCNNKCNLQNISIVTNRLMKYKNYVMLKDKDYNEEFIQKYFKFIKENKQFLIGRSNKGKIPIEFSEDIKMVLNI